MRHQGQTLTRRQRKGDRAPVQPTPEKEAQRPTAARRLFESETGCTVTKAFIHYLRLQLCTPRRHRQTQVRTQAQWIIRTHKSKLEKAHAPKTRKSELRPKQDFGTVRPRLHIQRPCSPTTVSRSLPTDTRTNAEWRGSFFPLPLDAARRWPNPGWDQ